MTREPRFMSTSTLPGVSGVVLTTNVGRPDVAARALYSRPAKTGNEGPGPTSEAEAGWALTTLADSARSSAVRTCLMLPTYAFRPPGRGREARGSTCTRW